MSYAETLAKQLRLIRIATGLSLRDIEKLTGIGNSTIWRVEQGKPVEYESGKVLEKWCESQSEGAKAYLLDLARQMTTPRGT